MIIFILELMQNHHSTRKLLSSTKESMFSKVESEHRIWESIVRENGGMEKLSRTTDNPADNWVLVGQQELA